MVQPVAGSNAEDVLPTHVEGMFRNERYIIAVIADFILSPVDGLIIGERGIRISVACVHAESIGQVSTQCRFSPIAPAFAGIDRNTPQSAFGKLGDLLITRIHQEGGKIHPQLTFPQSEVTTHFVIPGIFGLVDGRCFRIRILTRIRNIRQDAVRDGLWHALSHKAVEDLFRACLDLSLHVVLHITLYQIREHLYIVSSRTVSA